MSEPMGRNRGIQVDSYMTNRDHLMGTLDDYTIPPEEIVMKAGTTENPRPQRSIQRKKLKGKPNTTTPHVRIAENVYEEQQRQDRLMRKIQQLAKDPNYITD